MQTIFKSRKTQIYPTRKQGLYLDYLIDSRRAIWNQLHEWYKDNPKEALDNYRTPNRITKELDWVWDLDSRLIRTACNDYAQAWKSCFKKIRKQPKFKSRKHSKQSINYLDKRISIKKNILTFNKQKISIAENFENLSNKDIITFAISRENNKYYISITWKVQIKKEESKQNSLGIDWGIENFLTTSEEITYNIPKSIVRHQEKIIKLQKVLSKKTKKSNNFEKVRTKLSQQHKKIVNTKRDFIDKLTLDMLRNNSQITIEDLDIKEMIKTSHKNRRRNISINSFGLFKQILIDKSQRFTCEVRLADRYFPSTKKCSSCNNIQVVKLNERIYKCKNCGLEISRDLNASLNLKNYLLDNSSVMAIA
jgi:putative transposase